MALTDQTRSRIQQTLDQHKVVLFMKGNRQQPRCGFSAQVVSILSGLGVDFHEVDVLADPSIRDGIKEFGNWPTIPQLYYQSTLIGGWDIIPQLAESGGLLPAFFRFSNTKLFVWLPRTVMGSVSVTSMRLVTTGTVLSSPSRNFLLSAKICQVTAPV